MTVTANVPRAAAAVPAVVRVPAAAAVVWPSAAAAVPWTARVLLAVAARTPRAPAAVPDTPPPPAAGRTAMPIQLFVLPVLGLPVLSAVEPAGEVTALVTPRYTRSSDAPMASDTTEVCPVPAVIAAATFQSMTCGKHRAPSVAVTIEVETTAALVVPSTGVASIGVVVSAPGIT